MMESVRIGSTTVERCPSCHGIWLNALELDVLRRDRAGVRAVDRADADPTPAGVVLTCPDDHSRLIEMVDREQPHVRYHSCKICGGVLLDAGELRDLTQVTLRERLRAIFG